MRLVLLHIFLGLLLNSYGQFDPAGGVGGSLSVHRDESQISRWGDSVVIHRSWMDISDTSLGRVSAGEDINAINKADGAIVSLGDGGSATFFFQTPILDGEGYDFAVFENGFALGNGFFLELAFVEVSVKGDTFYRFPSRSIADTNVQFYNGSLLQPIDYYNLAGKHQAPYGTLFDLSEVHMDSIRYIRIVDVIGSIDPVTGSRDTAGWLINDPYPTAFESGGFDLDAVGIIDGGLLSIDDLYPEKALYPTFFRSGEQIAFNGEERTVNIYDRTGKLYYSGSSKLVVIDESGIYFAEFVLNGNRSMVKLCVF